MGLINWIFDFYQHSQIDRNHDETAQLRAEVASLRSSRGELDQERLLRAIGELALAVKTVQRLCVEKGLCSEAEWHRRAREIDLEDGRADGMAPPPR
ncbi:MAG TPA: hypothetical protein VFZ65_00260 [Planctomycetota bacterium]|nr:hypothetical protein [Planctomycetota bacterium]